MAGISASQQNLADRLAEVVRKIERAGGSEAVHDLARKVDEEARDIRRWARGTTLPGHVLVALLDELPRHYADFLIGGTSLRLVERDGAETACAVRAMAATATFAAGVARRLEDGEFCHRDDAESKDEARETITMLQSYVGE
ncbi:hypothetical protein BES08_10915 [Novosphingobium resinovorum]|uniref:Uncharacterized protein n=1 Tax=Novosphingobium resinovorum TaxID=158500 RepID=A0A1D8A507_9SPHN|nr:hypothetical protein BES08_10915 [Novosphingobium resinovorum]